jgi:hypothetical protein
VTVFEMRFPLADTVDRETTAPARGDSPGGGRSRDGPVPSRRGGPGGSRERGRGIDPATVLVTFLSTLLE